MGSLTFVRLMCVLLLLLCFGGSSCSSEFSVTGYDTKDLASDGTIFLIYERWLVEHGKVYNENELGEKQSRFYIFKDNLLYIDAHNRKNETYFLRLNKFSDLTYEEFRSKYVGTVFPKPSTEISSRYRYRHGDNLPEFVDWRQKGAVTHVRNQGQCGACWAFSTVAAVEGVNQIMTGKLIALSEQQLVDCSTTYNDGCNGGFMTFAFQYIVDNGGINSEDNYPYQEQQFACNTNGANVHVVSIDGYEEVPPYDESSLKKAVANQPISVAIETSGRDFQHYSSGLFTGSCGTNLDHAVTLVGYGSSYNDDYWIVKNSWGTSWGENGYIFFPRNINDSAGKCGLAMLPSYPIKFGTNPSKITHFPI